MIFCACIIRRNGTIGRVTLTSNVVSTVKMLQTGLNQPRGMVVDPFLRLVLVYLLYQCIGIMYCFSTI